MVVCCLGFVNGLFDEIDDLTTAMVYSPEKDGDETENSKNLCSVFTPSEGISLTLQ